ncbi:MAG TPA: M24 family metallopeptidase [Armatimonadota bacterium]|nr:M24 family metallopeptidase [Armatimonadota bacterium]HQK92000.1 M24 family metallopeptidase [Armatimonadota bacterium]
MVRQEVEAKLGRVRSFLDEQRLAALVLQSPPNVAWITGGADIHIQMAAESGAATVLVTPDRQCVVCSNIERPRLLAEELAGDEFELVDFAWHEADVSSVLRDLVPGGRVASDSGIMGSLQIPGQVHRLQAPLLPEELARYRALGGASGRALGEAMHAVEPGMSEHDVAARIAERALAAGVLPSLVLVAADERIWRYRHPIPTAARVTRHVMGVLVGRRWGLHSSQTRVVHFGAVPADLARRHAACVRVDAAMILSTVPGAPVAGIIRAALQAYSDAGFPDEWRLHHQGGATGYAARTYKGTPSSSEVVLENEGFAWNPSITGAKSEDTVLAQPGGPEVLSESPGWPMAPVEWGGRSIVRPDILVR